MKIDKVQAFKLAKRTGISAAKTYLDNKKISISPSTLSAEEQYPVLEFHLEKYQNAHNSNSLAKSTIGYLDTGLTAAIGAAIIYSPPAPQIKIPLLAFSAVLKLKNKIIGELIEDYTIKESKKYLSLIKDDLLKKSGAESFSKLAKDPEALDRAFDQSSDFLQVFQERVDSSNDPKLQEVVATTLKEVARFVDDAQLEAIKELNINVKENLFSIKKLELDTTTNLTQIENDLNTVKSSLIAIDLDVSDNQKRIAALEENQHAVTDFIFSKMPPSEKVLFIESGGLSGRINCNGKDNCSESEIKLGLLNQYKKEASVQQTLKKIQVVAEGVHNIGIIASNLGIGGPKLAKAIQVAETGLNAVMGFASGNFLAGLASLSGVFGSKKDADAERFKIMMNYLDKQFTVVNKKLDTLLEGQQKIYESIYNLSISISESFEHIDNKLMRIEYEQLTISNNIKILLWQDWRSCYSVYLKCISQNPITSESYYNQESKHFNSLDDMTSVLSTHGYTFKKSLNTIQESMDSLMATEWFGNFIDIKSTIKNIDRLIEDNIDLNHEKKLEINNWKKTSQLFIEKIHNPVLYANYSWADTHKVNAAKLLLLHTSPSQSVDELYKDIKEISSKILCEKNDPVNITESLLCNTSKDINEVSIKLLDTLVSPDIVSDIIDWMLVISPLVDIYDQQNDTFIDDILEISNLDSISASYGILRKSFFVSSLALSYFSKIYGGVTAKAILHELLTNSNQSNKIISLLKSNAYLAQNFAVLALSDGMRDAEVVGDLEHKTNKATMYQQALDTALMPSNATFMPLYAMFGDHFEFVKNDKNMLFFRITSPASNNNFVDISLPQPQRLIEGHFIYPEKFYSLLTKQNDLLERILNYGVMHKADENFAQIIMQ